MDYYDNDNDDYYYDEEEDDRDSLNAIQDVDALILPNDRSSTKVITKESLLAAQREDLRRIMEMLSIREHHARSLLIHYRWDVERVIAVLVEKGKDRLFEEAGVMVVEHSDPCLSSSSLLCEICFEEKSGNELTRMDCGHCYCNPCWTMHFIVKIKEGQSRRITCMAYKCHAICDEAIVINLVNASNPNLAEKFERFLLESYIEDNRRVKWCPSVPNCGNAIRVDDDELCEVECACGKQFCFCCSSEAHSPCSCLMWEMWAQKCRDESETVNWITVNTQKCPKCLKPVEKSGGCNLVICVCRQPFCWLCGGKTGTNHTWESIAGHSCGRYTEESINHAERAKKDLWRYIHYHNRYKAHTDSYQLETKLKEIIQEKICKLENKESASKDFTWVTNGLQRLFRSRRIIAYSYPFAFYMFGDDLFNDDMSKDVKLIKQQLFEDQQQQLEANIEKLSMCLEEPFDAYEEDKINEIRMRIITMSNIVDNLCGKMYECIENDLLGPLQQINHMIAPYHSEGVEKASELVDSGNTGAYSFSEGGSACQSSSCLENQRQSGCTSRKRPREGSLG